MCRTIILVGTLLIALSTQTAPVAVFHGLGDACINSGMNEFTKFIGKELGVVSHCFETGKGFSESMNHQVEKACDEIKKHKDFQGDFSVIGLSQGGLIARYIVEECNTAGKVKNLVSVGGPQMGVAKFPHCDKKSIDCDLMNSVTDDVVYSKLTQSSVGPAGYFRKYNNEEAYQKGSSFLAPLNNESGSINPEFKSKFSLLERVQLIMFSEDTMIIPKETAWFGFWDKDKNIQSYRSTNLYKNELIGLKKLDQSGRLNFDSIEGDHLQFKNQDILDKMIPFLR